MIDHRYTTNTPLTPPRRRAFTLIELLVVIAILALLTALLLPAISGIRATTRAVSELSALRGLMTAYQAYTNDYKGRVMPGYLDLDGIENEVGDPLGFPVNARYPWRLAPYLSYNFDGMYHDERVIESMQNANGGVAGQYVVSLYPSFAINSVFVGGHEGSWGGFNSTFHRVFGRHYVRASSEPKDPANLITFGSARGPNQGVGGIQGAVIEGWYYLQPPRFTDRVWDDTWDPESSPESFGFLSLRHNRKAAVSYFDGHTELIGEGPVQDMRKWSNDATRFDWQLTPR